MNGKGAFRDAPATPEQIFGVMKRRGYFEIDNLQISSTVAEFLDQFDLVDWKIISEGLCREFGVPYSKNEWRAVMFPAKRRTIRDICCHLATQAALPEVGTLKALGGECKTGAAFLALKHEMGKFGIKTQGLKPSMPIGETLRRHAGDMELVFSRFLRENTPKMNQRLSSTYKVIFWAVILGAAVCFSCGLVPYPFPVLGAAFCVMFLGIPILYLSNMPPDSVTMEGVTTFGDAARLIAAAHSNNI
jgi:hypothetical protein